MQVVRAEAMGMCFGVRDALREIEEVEDPASVTIFGELVHNEVVLRGLAKRGFAMAGEGDRGRLPATLTVLVTAHGLSECDRVRLKAAGKRIIDTTCPLVRRAHDAAKQLAAEGRHVIVVGRPGHVEVKGLIGDLFEVSVVEGPEQVPFLGGQRIGVVFQTTTPSDHALRTVAAIRARNPASPLRVIDTVCRPTRDRQASLSRLLGRVDRLVVVGGRHSNNTAALVRRGRTAGIPSIRVADETELDPAWFDGARRVGLTAGTSTLPETVDAVEQALERLSSPFSKTPALLPSNS